MASESDAGSASDDAERAAKDPGSEKPRSWDDQGENYGNLLVVHDLQPPKIAGGSLAAAITNVAQAPETEVRTGTKIDALMALAKRGFPRLQNDDGAERRLH